MTHSTSRILEPIQTVTNSTWPESRWIQVIKPSACSKTNLFILFRVTTDNWNEEEESFKSDFVRHFAVHNYFSNFQEMH